MAMQALKPVHHPGFEDYPAKILQMNRIVRAPAIRTLFGGEMGGKARGLTFLREELLKEEPKIRDLFGTAVRFAFPKTTVIGTDLFLSFMEYNHLWDVVERSPPDEELVAAFRRAGFSESHKEAIRRLFIVDGESGHARPMAVRSSQINEDSERATFAGIYKTVLIPNVHPSEEVRLAQLLEAMKIVYAGTFMQDAQQYRLAKGIKSSAVEMAVILQNVVGRLWNGSSGNCIYAPELSFAGFSYDPFAGEMAKAEHGYFNLAIGLGAGVVENEKTSVRFNMRRPDPPASMPDGEQALKAAPEKFYALLIDPQDARLPTDENFFLAKLPYPEHGNQELIGRHSSGYLVESGEGGRAIRLLEQAARPEDGPKILKFFRLMKGDFGVRFAEVMQFMNDAFRPLFGNKKVDFEGSADLVEGPGGRMVTVCYPLQVRVQASSNGNRVEALPEISGEKVALFAERAIGDGNKEIRHVLYIAPEKFNFARSAEIGMELGRVNATVFSRDSKYLLLAPGRVCTADETLGIKGSFSTVSHAAAIGEYLKEGVDPSGGAHIFQNIIEMRMAYFSYNDTQFSYGKLRSMASREEELGKYVVHLEFEAPLKLDMDAGGNMIIYCA